jgi:RNA polymerase sigma-70 factor (ECF subfamily)
MESSGEITQLLSLWAEGDQSALERVMPVVYQELRQIAQYHWNRQAEGHTLQPTALIHEAYLKLAAHEGKSFESRKQFFVLASIAMRQVLVNHAESRLARKRGGGAQMVSVDDMEIAVEQEAEQVLALHEAMKALHSLDPRKSRIVELRYFGGLTIEETAEALGVSEVTVTRDWRVARAFLYSRLEPGSAP